MIEKALYNKTNGGDPPLIRVGWINFLFFSGVRQRNRKGERDRLTKTDTESHHLFMLSDIL